MIVIVYRTNYIILAKDTYKRIEIRDIGFCYLLSNRQDNFVQDKQEYVLLELLRNYYDSKTIFLVPEILKALFVDLLRKNFDDKKIEDNNYFQLYLAGGTEKTDAIKNKMIGYAKANNPSPNEIEFIEIFRPNSTTNIDSGSGISGSVITGSNSVQENGRSSRMTAKEELITLFNTIVSQDNEIDAVFVCTYASNRTRIILSNTPTETRAVDIKSFAPIMKNMITALKSMKQVNPQLGAFDHLSLQHTKTGNSSGSIIHITHLSEYPEYTTFLLFVSATEYGIEMLEYFKDHYLDQIRKLLKKFLG